MVYDNAFFSKKYQQNLSARLHDNRFAKERLFGVQRTVLSMPKNGSFNGRNVTFQIVYCKTYISEHLKLMILFLRAKTFTSAPLKKYFPILVCPYSLMSPFSLRKGRILAADCRALFFSSALYRSSNSGLSVSTSFMKSSAMRFTAVLPFSLASASR